MHGFIDVAHPLLVMGRAPDAPLWTRSAVVGQTTLGVTRQDLQSFGSAGGI